MENYSTVPGERIELSCLATHDFESCASTNSAIPAIVKSYLKRGVMKRRFARKRPRWKTGSYGTPGQKEVPDTLEEERGDHKSGKL